MMSPRHRSGMLFLTSTIIAITNSETAPSFLATMPDSFRQLLEQKRRAEPRCTALR